MSKDLNFSFPKLFEEQTGTVKGQINDACISHWISHFTPLLLGQNSTFSRKMQTTISTDLHVCAQCMILLLYVKSVP